MYPTNSDETNKPTKVPTHGPTKKPVTAYPSIHPTNPGESMAPTIFSTKKPSRVPTNIPTKTGETNPPSSYSTIHPTVSNTRLPTPSPTTKGQTNPPSKVPTRLPTTLLTRLPTIGNTHLPTIMKTIHPSQYPSKYPTFTPTKNPIVSPTFKPTNVGETNPPTSFPTSNMPTAIPTEMPSNAPVVPPTFNPTRVPISFPTWSPTTEFDTQMPTLSYDIVVSFQQTIDGCGYANYTQNSTAYDLAITNAIVACIPGLGVSNIVYFEVASDVSYSMLDYTIHIAKRMFDYSSQLYNSKQTITKPSKARSGSFSERRLFYLTDSSDLSTSSSLYLYYTISTTNSAYTEAGLTDELSNAIADGLFNNFLNYYAGIFGAPALVSAQSTTVTADSTGSSSNNSSNHDLSGGIIALIVILVVVACGGCVVGTYFFLSLKPRSAVATTGTTAQRESIQLAPAVSDLSKAKESNEGGDIENPIFLTGHGVAFGTVIAQPSETSPSAPPIESIEETSVKVSEIKPVDSTEPVKETVKVTHEEPTKELMPKSDIKATDEAITVTPSITTSTTVEETSSVSSTARSTSPSPKSNHSSTSEVRPTSTSRSVSPFAPGQFSERGDEGVYTGSPGRVGSSDKMTMETNPMAALRKKKTEKK